MHSNVLVKRVISGKTLDLTEYEAAIVSSEDVTPTHFVKKRRNFLNGLFQKKSQQVETGRLVSKPIKKPFSLKFNIMQRIRNASAKKSIKLANKRHTPEGAILSVSETSLLDVEPSDDHTDTLKIDNNEPSTSNLSSAIQPQQRIVLQNEIQPAKEEEAIEVKSESSLSKTLDTSPTDGNRRQTNVDALANQSVKITPHSTSEVSITKVSVAPVLCDLKGQSEGKGALQTVITTTSHLHQTRQRQVKTKSLPSNAPDECVNWCANDQKSVVQDIVVKDEDRRSSVDKTEEFKATKKSHESGKKIQFLLDPKVFENTFNIFSLRILKFVIFFMKLVFNVELVKIL